jgi:hypothetical protein
MEYWILCKTHNYREESYIVPEELVSYLQSLYLVLLFSLVLQQEIRIYLYEVDINSQF